MTKHESSSLQPIGPDSFAFRTSCKSQPISIQPFLAANSGERQDQTCQHGLSSPRHLAFGWSSDLQHSCSQAIQTILNHSREESTRKCCLAKWRCFCTWVQWNQLSEPAGSPNQVPKGSSWDFPTGRGANASVGPQSLTFNADEATFGTTGHMLNDPPVSEGRHDIGQESG